MASSVPPSASVALAERPADEQSNTKSVRPSAIRLRMDMLMFVKDVWRKTRLRDCPPAFAAATPE